MLHCGASKQPLKNSLDKGISASLRLNLDGSNIAPVIINVSMSDQNSTIIIFDTDCVLCSKWIRFILRHEAAENIQFASSRKPKGKKLAEEFGVAPDALDLTYVVIDRGQVHIKSNASLVILGQLRRPWSWLRVLGLVPRSMRDRMYDVVARNRLRWFGEEPDCFLPSLAQRQRFLD